MEQRTRARFELHLPFEVRGIPCVEPLAGYTRNVSMAGVLLDCALNIDEGCEIEYLLTLPRGAHETAQVQVKCVGRVVRSRPERSELAATIETYEFVRGPLGAAA